jgi:hypothetical protein
MRRLRISHAASEMGVLTAAPFSMQHPKTTHRSTQRQDETSSMLMQLRASLLIVLVIAGVAALMFASQLLGMAMHWAMALE